MRDWEQQMIEEQRTAYLVVEYMREHDAPATREGKSDEG